MKSTAAGLASPCRLGYASRSAYAIDGAVAGRLFTKTYCSRRVGDDRLGRSMKPLTAISPDLDAPLKSTGSICSEKSSPNSSRILSADDDDGARRYASRPSIVSEKPIAG